jgi:hypothetical protein
MSGAVKPGNVVVTASFHGPITTAAILGGLSAKYDLDITHPGEGVEVSLVVWNFKPLSECFDCLASVNGWRWEQVDNIIHFFED